MSSKQTKLIMETWNKFLNESPLNTHSDMCRELFNCIEGEFKDYIKEENRGFHNARTWLDGSDFDSQEEEDELEEFFNEVAEACGCKLEDLLVNHIDIFHDEIYPLNSSDFLNSYSRLGNRCGEFNLGGDTLKGFYGNNYVIVAPKCNSIDIEDERVEHADSPKINDNSGMWD